jgi:hypothetical protein
MISLHLRSESMPPHTFAFIAGLILLLLFGFTRSQPTHDNFVAHARLGAQGRLGNQMFQW